MKWLRLLFLINIIFSVRLSAASHDSICAHPLHYEVVTNNESIDSFLWMGGDRKFNLYYKGHELLLEHRRRHEFWRVNCLNYSPYPGSDLFIDTMYLKDISESGQKELFVAYSLYSLKGTSSGKSHHLLIIDIRDKKVLLNIATYDSKITTDENGRVLDYYYEADIEFHHNAVKVIPADESEIDNPAIQLEEGTYHRRGHCFVHSLKW
jgi:hypothetical protein